MDISASDNFYRLIRQLTTSGIVRADGLKALRAQGYDVVVNLLPDSSENAIFNERDMVESQGIEYIHIPVDFTQPTLSDFLKFSEALDRVAEKKVHIHCAANYRVSVFSALYLLSRGFWNTEQAFEFIHSIWQPAEHPGWSEFIAGVLAGVTTHHAVPVDHRQDTERAEH